MEQITQNKYWLIVEFEYKFFNLVSKNNKKVWKTNEPVSQRCKAESKRNKMSENKSK